MPPDHREPAPSPHAPPADAGASAPPSASGRVHASRSTRIRIEALCSVECTPFAMVFRPDGETEKAWAACDVEALPPSGGSSSGAGDAAKKFRLHGAILVGGEYPGCPYCKGGSFSRHSSCESFVCSGAKEGESAYCPRCDVRFNVKPGMRDITVSAAPEAQKLLPGDEAPRIEGPSSGGVVRR